MIDLTKTYRTRNGRVVTELHERPRHAHNYDTYPLTAKLDGEGAYTFTALGRYVNGETGHLDLVPIEETASVPIASCGTMDIGSAVTLMRAGHKVARTGWNGKGMFLYHVQANAYPAQSAAAKSHFGESALVPYQAYIAMKTADGTVVPWLCSQSDLLALDWQIAQ